MGTAFIYTFYEYYSSVSTSTAESISLINSSRLLYGTFCWVSDRKSVPCQVSLSLFNTSRTNTCFLKLSFFSKSDMGVPSSCLNYLSKAGVICTLDGSAAPSLSVQDVLSAPSLIFSACMNWASS